MAAQEQKFVGPKQQSDSISSTTSVDRVGNRDPLVDAHNHNLTTISAQPPPYYDTLPSFASSRLPFGARYVGAHAHSLAFGHPEEIISVPMICSVEKRSIKALILCDVGKVSRTVVVRRMRRSHYLRYYATDVDGSYIGTEKPAPDAGLVFVPSKSTPEDILEQVHKVAHGRRHRVA